MSLPTISPAAAKKLIAQGATLIDIRGADEYARENIPGASNKPLGDLKALGHTPGPIIFHCRSGGRTAANAPNLAAVAQSSAPTCEAYILEGGIEAWKAAGLPVSTD
jgi:rhodanese-related sulfurtransferase